MIRLEIEEYCHGCLEFNPDMIKGQKGMTNDGELIIRDTIIQCEYRKRCNNIRRFLEHQMRGDCGGKYEANV